MRIAMVSEHASPLAALGGADAGGQNVHVGALSAALARQGHEVMVHTRRDDPSLPEFVTAPDGVIVHHVDAGPPTPVAKDALLPWMGTFASALMALWSDWRPDLVHAHFWMSGMASLDAGRTLGLPVLQTFHALGVVKRRHQGRADTSPAARENVEATLMAEVDRVVATCHDEARELYRLGTDRRRVEVVPSGVDTSLFQPEGDTWARNSERRITVIGRLVPRKGVDSVIRALPSVAGAELVIAGGPAPSLLRCDPEARRLMSIAAEQGVTDRVRFVGCLGRPEVPALLRSSDVVVCVPAYEPFGIVPLEAMACGVPVVASAVGGLQESVVDGRTGLLVPPSDPARLAEALQSLLRDEATRRSFGRAGVERVRRRYSWPRIAARTASVYHDVLASSRAAAR